MNILAFDVGASGGMAFSDGSVRVTDEYKIKKLTDFNRYVKEKVELYSPDLIIVGRPTRFHNTIVAHSKYIGLIEMAAEKDKIKVVMVTDSSCKKHILGSGKAEKKEIVAWAKPLVGDISEDAADALMFAEFALKTM